LKGASKRGGRALTGKELAENGMSVAEGDAVPSIAAVGLRRDGEALACRHVRPRVAVRADGCDEPRRVQRRDDLAGAGEVEDSILDGDRAEALPPHHRVVHGCPRVLGRRCERARGTGGIRQDRWPMHDTHSTVTRSRVMQASTEVFDEYRSLRGRRRRVGSGSKRQGDHGHYFAVCEKLRSEGACAVYPERTADHA
jgi:hypothetical protein